MAVERGVDLPPAGDLDHLGVEAGGVQQVVEARPLLGSGEGSGRGIDEDQHIGMDEHLSRQTVGEVVISSTVICTEHSSAC